MDKFVYILSIRVVITKRGGSLVGRKEKKFILNRSTLAKISVALDKKTQTLIDALIMFSPEWRVGYEFNVDYDVECVPYLEGGYNPSDIAICLKDGHW